MSLVALGLAGELRRRAATPWGDGLNVDDEGNQLINWMAEIKQDTIVTSLTPHMHVRGKDMTYTAVYPDGTSEVLLRVPKYDFNWQPLYVLNPSKFIPAGTRVVMAMTA